jgi:hydrogenase maturation protease
MIEKPSEGTQSLVQQSLRKVILIGIGNEYRSDDGVGLLIARQIRDRHLSFVSVKEESGEGAALMEAWQGYESVILVDAISSGSPPGTIIKINAGEKNVPAKFFHYSTHAFSIAEAIELARTMKTLPQRVFVYGIEGANFTAGVRLSRVVRDSAKTVVKQILKQIKTLDK